MSLEVPISTAYSKDDVWDGLPDFVRRWPWKMVLTDKDCSIGKWQSFSIDICFEFRLELGNLICMSKPMEHIETQNSDGDLSISSYSFYLFSSDTVCWVFFLFSSQVSKQNNCPYSKWQIICNAFSPIPLMFTSSLASKNMQWFKSRRIVPL